MTFNEALKQASQHQWWSEDAPGKYQYSYWMNSFVEQRKYYHPDYLSVMFCVSDNGFVEEKTPSDERLKIYEWVKDQQHNDASSIYQLHENAVQMKQRALAAGEKAMMGIDTKSKNELLNNFHELKYAAKDFEIIRSFGGWMDERKETMVKINEFLFHILQRIAALTQVPKAEIEMYFNSEIDALIQTGKRVDQQTLQLRNGLVVYATQYDGYDGSTMTLFTGEEAKQLAHVLHGVRQEQISGIVASKGSHNLSVFEGTVQVVMDVSKEQFINGSVLVTSMTRPEFVPLVKRSSAVITDEGGITCHAAIVSRELGIPCIIGTRQATKQFKNGDHIRMNLETGEVTHL